MQLRAFTEDFEMKILGMALLLVAACGLALAQQTTPLPSPEIDAGSAGSAVVLLAGALLVFRARLKK